MYRCCRWTAASPVWCTDDEAHDFRPFVAGSVVAMTQKFSREEFDVYVWEGTSDIASRAEV